MGHSRIVRHMRSLLALFLLCVVASTASAADTKENMSLVDAIESVRAQGLEVVYSSQKIQPWMRVNSTPSSTDPWIVLREALAEYDLDLRRGPAGRWLVVDLETTQPTTTGNSPVSIPVFVAPSLEEIKIVASRYSMFSNDGTSEHFLSGDEIRLIPHIADDAFRAFHRLPGVAANDFQAAFNIRGGTTDEVKIVLDGVELFEPYHMRSLFSPLSVIDPGIIGDAQVLSGGFTAEHGNHMSGVIDMNTRHPTGAPVHQLGVSFVSAFARTSGTFAEERGTYHVSARRGYLDILADTVSEDGEELTPRYGDVFARVSYSLTDSIELEAHVLTASDDVKVVDLADHESFGEDSRLNYAWFSVDAELTDDLTLSGTFSAGSVEADEVGLVRDLPFEIITRTFDTDIDISGLQTDLAWKSSETTLWKLGARYRNLSADFDYDIDSLRQTDFVNNGVPYTLVREIDTSREGEEYGASAAFRFQVFDDLAWELGLRWDKQTYTDLIDDTQLSPRVNGFYQLGERTELRLGWGRYYQPQGIQELQVIDGVSNYFPAQRAEHRIIGIKHRYPSGIDLQLDFYEKTYSDVRPRFENALDKYQFAPESNFDRILIEPDRARSRGMELTLHDRQSSKLDWWLNYTWSEVYDVIDGIEVARSWDQRHALAGNVTWHGEHWTLNAVARYHSGWPRTQLQVIPAFDSAGNFTGAESDFSNLNTESFDDYFRVDVRLSRTLELANSNLEFYLEVFNLLNNENQCCIGGHRVQIRTSIEVSPNFDEFLPFFPSFGFVWTFGAGAK